MDEGTEGVDAVVARLGPASPVGNVLKFFRYEHLPEKLQAISRPFAELAVKVANGPACAETTVALRKLLEAKDCAVRAYVS
jgi:hypothetical protein